ncbi:uncharacterized protein FIBRA_00465 [Fibroporia radiculosa]|uniref:Alanine dehydrogenase/pyridine nucleotide transhydrogenase N-terminal domain-containing protein n=1 Tax=Fibroporia radiculosa TaxID=599839 RepID=J4HRN3_9APHY|nr:uncharacterized protein FIBRA_00465 [Fibroporia radiculosa]CCL98467.1 predicted protein [Fibroporia radiculosa]
MAVLRRSSYALARISPARPYATSSNASKLTIGIRREDPLRIWERRCPLTPDVVNELTEKEGVDVLIQECERRVWSTDEFVKAGARVHPTLYPAHIILGIKETPLQEVFNDPIPALSGSVDHPLLPRTHLMFSHTIKGQMYNMELLSKFVSSDIPGGTQTQDPALLPRLIDYELLTGEDGKRTVGFGWFAGVAGALESLSALAHAQLELGVASPFLYTPRPHSYPTLASIRALLKDVVGARIALEGTPKSLGPLVFGVTGMGKVAQGVLDLLEDLPIEKVKVRDLPALVGNPDTDLHKIYVVHALPEDYFVRNDGMRYSRSDYYANPQDYQSEFHSKIAPYLSLLLHGAGWSPSYPRLMTNEQLTLALEKAQQVGRGRFACVGDISCDIEGGLEFLPNTSTLSAPFFSTRPNTLPAHLPSVTMMAVDILPTALPLEASQHFCRVLMPYLRSLIAGYRGTNTRQGKEHEALDKATVAWNGKLTEKHAWLQKPLGIWSRSTAASAAAARAYLSQISSDTAKRDTTLNLKKKVLMLGSGMVAGPAIEEICKRPDVQLLVASNSLADAERQTGSFANATARLVDMSDAEQVGQLIQESDLVISLLPVPFHPAVAKLCILHRKHLVTASYISPTMRALHDEAVAADVLLLNEIGLDPGIDHCSAISLLDSIRAQGKEIVSFTSFCGGLPAPECAEDVPLGYKFSWSPKGVLTATLNAATFRVRGKNYHIDGSNLLPAHIPDIPVSKVIKFEGLANRDSLPYAKFYGLGPADEMRTIFRGTLRYPGFSRLMNGFSRIGLLDSSAPIRLDSWTSLARKSLEERLGTLVMDDDLSIRSAIRDAVESVSLDEMGELVDSLCWLSCMPHSALESVVGNQTASLPPLPSQPMLPIDLFATLLAHKLRYQPAERDLVVLHHEIVARPQGRSDARSVPSTETHTSSLISYGTPQASAMSRCVGLPVAFAALQVLEGSVQLRGVHGPTDKAVYENVLRRLTEVGLGVSEGVRRGTGSVEDTLHRHFSNRGPALEA